MLFLFAIGLLILIANAVFVKAPSSYHLSSLNGINKIKAPSSESLRSLNGANKIKVEHDSDLLNFPTRFSSSDQVVILVHQFNAVSNGGGVEGIAKVIFETYPDANIYKGRNPPNNVGKAGTCDVVLVPDHRTQAHVYVANLIGQFNGGGPQDIDFKIKNQKTNDTKQQGVENTTQNVVDDTKSSRAKYFQSGLDQLTSMIYLLSSGRSKNDIFIAFPGKIGCGIAGGDWKQYLQMIREFANNYPNVYIIFNN